MSITSPQDTRRSEAPTPLERIEALADRGSFHEWRSGVDDGVVAGQLRISGRPAMVWSQDGRRRGGALGAAAGETIARTIDRADRAGVPVVGFAASGGARIQEGVAALSAYAAIFRAQSLARVPQVTVVCGACAGGAAYATALGDITITAGDDAKLFLTGSQVVERVTGHWIDPVELGGPQVHARNGVAQLHAHDPIAAAGLARDVISHLPQKVGGDARLWPPREPLEGDPSEHVPSERRRVYDVRDVARRLIDGGELIELAPRWARNIVVGFARIDGRPVGVIANQPRHLGGTIDSAASEKGSWFVRLCERFGLPLCVLVDTPGFLPGQRQESAGVIRHGAGLLEAFATATVPRITVTLRQAYGGAHIVMNSRDLGADLVLAWPDASIGIMGARQAVELIERRTIAAGADPVALADRYEAEHLPVGLAAGAGFVDEVVEPADTRRRIAEAISLAS
ncbi:methylmalonyl-CoA carboxyltransferase [Thermoleophilia bacterium SCSIO 60948]|nr:methylmalonyl-CoA carboxyltransferase [Thermoleophilia bacterium SCSIO 60948]